MTNAVTFDWVEGSKHSRGRDLQFDKYRSGLIQHSLEKIVGRSSSLALAFLVNKKALDLKGCGGDAVGI